MSHITDTISSIGDNLRNAYTSLSNKGAIIPAQKNIENIAATVDTITGSGGSSKMPSLIDKTITTVTPGDFGNATLIGGSVFSYCTDLTTVTMSNNITSISSSAFAGCSSLNSITFSTALQSIGTQAFINCVGLTSIDLGENVDNIASSAFASCTHLESFTIRATTPPSLSNTNAFSNTNSCPIYVPAESVNLYKGATNWVSLASRIQAIV